MLKTKDYKEQIVELYNQGLDAKEISRRLGFTYHQPVYNMLKKLELPLNQRVYQRKYTLNESFFKTINTESKAYLLGFICADGFISSDRLVLTLSIQDTHILEDIKKLLNSNQPLSFSKRRNPYLHGKEFCEMVTLQISSKEFVKPLLIMIPENKTYSLNSSVLKFVPKYLIKDFLRGYFDGDGNVMWSKQYSSGKKYNINICGNEEFLLNTYQKYFPSQNKMYFEKKSKQMFVWKLSSKENVQKFLAYLYTNSSVHLKRKYKQYLKSKMVI